MKIKHIFLFILLCSAAYSQTDARYEKADCIECYMECGFTANSGITINQYTLLGQWSSVTGTSGISQEEIGVDNAGNPIWGPTIEPNAPGNFPDQDPNYPNLPWYLGEPSEDPVTVVNSFDPNDLRFTDKYGANREYEKAAYEVYFTMPPGCVSGNTTVQFRMERIVGRGWAGMYISEDHNPANAVFQFGYNRSNNNPIRFNYNHPGSQVYELSETCENKFYVRVYMVDGSEPSATNGHFNAAAFNATPQIRIDGGGWTRIPLNGDFAATSTDANGRNEGVRYVVEDGEAKGSDESIRTESELLALPNIEETNCSEIVIKD